MNPYNYVIKSALEQKNMSEEKLDKIKRQVCFKYKISMPTNIILLKAYHKLLKTNKIKKNIQLENLLKTRKVRSLSGIASVTVITKPYPCPGKCIFCPTEKNMPKSYLKNEPACMRALLNKFDPYKQAKMRLQALEMTGHPTDKIELIVLGGTWSYYKKQYQTYFIKRCFDACNKKTSKTLKQAQKINEKTKHRIIGLTLETRPDYINEKEIKRMRNLGCTRIELGVQTIYQDILDKNKREISLEQIKQATKLLKDSGFKITYHMMLNLPYSNIKKDEKMFEKLFTNDFQPDQLKIYPCAILKTAKLYKLYKKNKYKPYTINQLINVLVKIKKIIPEYVRIIRIIRDIPSQDIVAGSKRSNLRQDIQKKVNCRCIRCREIKDIKTNNIKFKKLEYKASDAKEIFLSFEDDKKDKLLAFLRLRITDNPIIKNSTLIREVHTYGQTVPINKNIESAKQHKNLGKRLINEAEKISKDLGYKKTAVIAGIGTREYYRKLGYKLENEYMVKNF